MRLFALLVLAAVLTACGFHLRGQGPGGQFPYDAAQVDGNGPVAEQLRQSLRLLGNVALVTSASPGAARIEVGNESSERKVGTLNSSGRVSEYRLFYTVSYRVFAPDGAALIGTSVLRLNRDYTYDENNALGNEAQEQMLIRDMQQSAAQQILRRTAALARQAEAQDAVTPTPQPGLPDAR